MKWTLSSLLSSAFAKTLSPGRHGTLYATLPSAVGIVTAHDAPHSCQITTTTCSPQRQFAPVLLHTPRR
jgi:hypothetical protein